jgi:phage minor structural protein
MTLLDVFTDERIDQSDELTFVYPATDPKAALLLADADVQRGGKWYFVAEKIDQRQDTQVTTTVRCVANWYRLGERIRVGSTNLEAVTCAAGLATLLDGTDWGVGNRTAAGGAAFSYEDQDQSVLALVRAWATVCDKVVVFDTENKTVDLIDESDRGFNTGMMFRWSRNLTSIERRVQPPDVTRLYPFGRDDLSITGVNGGFAYIEDFSFYTSQGITLATARERYRKDDVWVNTDIVDEASLLAAAQTRLAERSAALIEYRLSVADLSELTGNSEAVGVGDTVRVADEELGFDVETTVVRRVHYPLQPWRDQIELAYLYDPADSAGGSNDRAKSGLTWEMFQSRSSRFVIRDGSTWTTNRIGVSFAGAAEAVYGYDLTFTGVGTGSLSVSAIDAESDELEHPVIEYPYTDGEQVHAAWTWSHDSADPLDELNGQKDYRIKVRTTASGPSLGVNINATESRFWILARGATKRTPVAVNSQRFEYTGTAQEFVVPDGVTEVEVEVAGARCTTNNMDPAGYGRGGIVTGTMPVISGQTLKVIVGGTNGGFGAAAQSGTPSMRGGQGDSVTGANGFAGGGGSGVFPPTATATTQGLLIAGGAGGNGQIFPSGSWQVGGYGGFFAGQPTNEITSPNNILPAGSFPGAPADQFGGGGAGGVASFSSGAAGDTGGNGTGGVAGDATNSFSFAPGGGGGGYHGGGGAGTNNGNGNGTGGGGGGGCGYAAPSIVITEVNDNSNDGNGYIEFRWDTPE